MKISEFLREEQTVAVLGATDKAGVLGELCASLARVQGGLDQAKLLETLLAREKLGSTGIGEGVAIPHGKLPGLGGLLAAFGRSVQGVDFQSIDGKPTHLFFVLFAPEASAGLHLKALARISRLLRSPALRKALLEADGAHAIHKLLAEEDAKY
jgi:PTS system nitrogen regulatory IIA component